MKLTTRMAGRTVRDVIRCDTYLEVRFTDNTSLKVGWRNDSGELVKGEPDILFEGTHIVARVTRLGTNGLGRVHRRQEE